MALTLKDDKGGLVSVLADEQFNFKDLMPGEPSNVPLRTNESRFTVGQIAPTTKSGQYTVFVSVGQRDGTPKIALPMGDDDGQRRYRLGKITVKVQ